MNARGMTTKALETTGRTPQTALLIRTELLRRYNLWDIHVRRYLRHFRRLGVLA